MKKSYSTLNILQKQLCGMKETKSFFQSWLSGRKYITLALPYYDYIRGKIFIEDLRDQYGDEVPLQFNMAVLLYMLYDDFLMQIKKGAKNEQIASYLICGKKRYFQPKVQERKIMKSLTPRVFEFKTVQEEIKEDENIEEKITHITVRIRESEILRGEILLHDLFHEEQIEMTVEEMIAIIYLDFIQNIKEEGNSVKVQKSILKHLKAETEV